MKIRILLLFLTTLFMSCAGDRYGRADSQTPPPNAQGAGGFTPTSYSTQIGGTPTHISNAQNSCTGGKWGGVTCRSGNNRDDGFLGYLSNGTNINANSNTAGVLSISCNPSNNGGVLFQLRVILNGPFNPKGDNKTALTMMPGLSKLELVVYDTVGTKTSTGTTIQPIGAVFNGVSGTVTGNRANLKFSYTGANGTKTIDLNGTFNEAVFQGQMTFTNTQYWDGKTPGASGTLGDFKISTCTTFFSN